MAVGNYITTEGLQIPTVEKLLIDLSAEQRANIDPNLNTDADSVVGQLNGIVSSHLREAYEVLRITHGGFDPDNAEGFLLAALCSLTGTTPAAATRSVFSNSRKLKIGLDASKTIPSGTVFHVSGDPTTRFATTESITSTTAGFYYVSAECDQTGAIHCNAGTLLVIATPVVGLNSVINEYDAIVGQAADSDQQLRERRESELRATGSGTVDSLRSDVIDIKLSDDSNPILNCTVFENDTNAIDVVTGNAAHSMEVLVFDGVVPACPNDIIAQAIWNSKPGGILMLGSSNGNAIDRAGVTRIVPFTRTSIIEIKFQFSLVIETAKYAGDNAAKAAVQNAFTSKVNPGKTIRANDYVKALLGVAGVLDITNMQIAKLADAFPVDGTNLSLGLREMGNADSSNMSITTTPGVP